MQQKQKKSKMKFRNKFSTNYKKNRWALIKYLNKKRFERKRKL